jgi:hypothetical protein
LYKVFAHGRRKAQFGSAQQHGWCGGYLHRRLLWGRSTVRRRPVSWPWSVEGSRGQQQQPIGRAPAAAEEEVRESPTRKEEGGEGEGGSQDWTASLQPEARRLGSSSNREKKPRVAKDSLVLCNILER